MTFDPRWSAVVRLDDATRRRGDLLVGGSPSTVVRLTAGALDLVEGDRLRVDGRPAAVLADRLVALNLAHPDPATLPPVDLAEVTVVVPVKERAAELDRLLHALDGRVRIVVVDDGSRDGRSLADVAQRHGADLVRLAENRGPAAARNAGLAEVETPYVAFVDSDVTVSPAALAIALGHFADPDVAVVGPRVRGRATDGAAWFERYEESCGSLDLRDRPTTVRPFARVSWLPSACILARVAAVDGGFDETMRVGEDVDFVWRALARGHRVLYEPAAVAEHDARSTFRSWWSRKAYYGSGGAALHRRHGDLVAPAVLPPLHTAAVIALVAQRRWSVPVAAGLVGLSAARIATSLPAVQGRTALATRLALSGLSSTGWQFAAMALRHHWPVAAAGCLGSARLRRAVAVAALVDGLHDHRARGSELNPPAHVAARRLDDLAYGTGLWWGATRARQFGVLRPRFRMRRSRPR